jgi:hypothetical protein
MAKDRPASRQGAQAAAERRGHAGFAAYNLGIALLQDGRTHDAVEQLDKAGQLKAEDRAGLAIRDKSNLVLGTILFESADTERAKQSLDRVASKGRSRIRLCCGPAGRRPRPSITTARSSRGTSWRIVSRRTPRSKKPCSPCRMLTPAWNLHGRAALTYGRALEQFGSQIERVDASIGSIREGRFLKALIREESRQDKDGSSACGACPTRRKPTT